MAIGEHEILTLVLHVMWEKKYFPSFLISSLQLKTFTHLIIKKKYLKKYLTGASK
jgi:hypothetical protein